jgi:hypothetical protein
MAYRIVAFLSQPRASGQPADVQPQAPSEGIRMASLLYESALRRDPGVTLTILSDLRTDLGHIDTRAEIVRYDLGDVGVMMARTDAQLRYVETCRFDQPLAFLDLDILVNRPIGFLFERPFDIGLTVRRKPKAPINGGVILASRRNPDAVRSFFRSLASLYHSSYADRGAWWGDQEALNDLVGTGLEGSASDSIVRRDSVDYLLLPSKRFNYSPHWLAATLSLPRRSRYLLHFKSAARKRYMEPFFRRHVTRDKV